MANKDKNPPVEETTSDAGGAEGVPAKKGGKLKLIIIGVVAMLIGCAVGAFVLGGLLGGSKDAADKGAETEVASTEQDGGSSAIESPPKSSGGKGEGDSPTADLEQAGPQNIAFKTFSVNLSGGGGKRFLKLTMSLDADTQELADEINAKMPQFQDTILMLLSSLTFDDISTLEGKTRLRSQIINRINTHLTKGKIRNIYFLEFIVQ